MALYCHKRETAKLKEHSSKSVELHLKLLVGLERHLAEFPLFAALLRSTQYYEARSGYLSADPPWHR